MGLFLLLLLTPGYVLVGLVEVFLKIEWAMETEAKRQRLMSKLSSFQNTRIGCSIEAQLRGQVTVPILLPLLRPVKRTVSQLSHSHHTQDSKGYNERDPLFIQQRRLRHRLRTIGLWQHTNVLLCHDWHKGQPHLRGRVPRCQHCPVIFRRSHHTRSQGTSEGLVAGNRGAFTLW